MRGRGLAGAAVGVLIAVLTGCSSEDPPPSSAPPLSSSGTSQAPTTSASPTPTAVTEAGPPVLPAQAQQLTPGGAAAFVRYWYDVLLYSEQVMDSAPLRALDDGSCLSCDNFSDTIDSVAADGNRLEGGEVTVLNAEPSGVQSDGSTTVNTLVAYPEQRIVSPDGSSEVLGPAEDSIGFFFRVARVEAAWRVDEIQLLG